MRPQSLGDIHRAIAQDRLELWYQPRIGMRDNDIQGAEALLRMRGPEGEVIPPGLFLPLAEDQDLLVNITLRSFPRLVRESQELRAAIPDLVVAFNLSARDLEHPEVLETILLALEREQISAGQLEIELTESRQFIESPLLKKRLDLLVDAGIGLAMDDFGTGHSNIESLRQLPFSTLKLDRGVVSTLWESPKSRAIAASIPSMIQGVGIRTVAEGIEDEQTHEFVREAGYDEAQGYYYAKPMPLDEFVAFAATPRHSQPASLAPIYQATTELLHWRQRVMSTCRSALGNTPWGEREAITELRNWHGHAKVLLSPSATGRLERCFEGLRASARSALSPRTAYETAEIEAMVESLHTWSTEAVGLLLDQECDVLTRATREQPEATPQL